MVEEKSELIGERLIASKRRASIEVLIAKRRIKTFNPSTKPKAMKRNG